jgi:hypothetical protein
MRSDCEQCVGRGVTHCGVFVLQRSPQSWRCQRRFCRKCFQPLGRSATEVWARLTEEVCKHRERRGRVFRLSEEVQRTKGCVGNFCVLILRQCNECRSYSCPAFGIGYKNSLQGINHVPSRGMARPECNLLERLECLRAQKAQCFGSLARYFWRVCAIQNLDQARNCWSGCIPKNSEASYGQTYPKAGPIGKNSADGAILCERPRQLYYRVFELFSQGAGLKSDPVSEKGKRISADLANSCFGLRVLCRVWPDAVVEMVRNLKPVRQRPTTEGGFGWLSVLEKHCPYRHHAEAKCKEPERPRSHEPNVT